MLVSKLYDVPLRLSPARAPHNQHQPPYRHSAGASACHASCSHLLPVKGAHSFRMWYTKQLSVSVTQLTLRIRSSTLSCGKERMAAMVRMSLSDNEYLLWILCMMYHIVELMWNNRTFHPHWVTPHRDEMAVKVKKES